MTENTTSNDSQPMDISASHEKKRRDYIHSVDVGVLRFCREKKAIEILLVKRTKEPFANCWALPGIVINGDTPDDSIEMALSRLLHSEKVGLTPKYIEQVETVGNGTRDPRCWSSSTFYLALVDDTFIVEGEKMFVSISDIKTDKIALPFDHNFIVRKMCERLWSKSLYSSLPLLMLPDEFTATETISVFSTVLDRPVMKSSMHLRLAKLENEGYVQKTNQKVKAAMGPPQTLYVNLKNNAIYLFDRCFEQ